MTGFIIISLIACLTLSAPPAAGATTTTRPVAVLHEKLRKPITVEFPGTSFENVVDFLTDLTGISFEPDRDALQRKKIGPDTAIRLRLDHNVRLQSALNLIVDQVDLVYVIDGKRGRVILTDDVGATKLLAREGFLPAPPAPRDSPALKRLRKGLPRRLTIEFPGTDFYNVLDFFRDLTGVNIVLDRRLDAQIRASSHSPVVILKPQKMPVHWVLDRVPKHVNGACVIRDETIFITTAKRARELLRQDRAMTYRQLSRIVTTRPSTDRPDTWTPPDAPAPSEAQLREMLAGGGGTTQFYDTAFDDAVEVMKDVTGLNIEVDPAARKRRGAAGPPTVWLMLKGMATSSMLDLMTDQAGMVYVINPRNGITITDPQGARMLLKKTGYRAAPLPPSEGAALRWMRPELSEPYWISFRGKSLRAVLDRLADRRGTSYVLDSVTAKAQGVDADTPITLRTGEMPFNEALDRMATLIGLTWVIRSQAIYLTSPARARELVKEGRAMTYEQLRKRTSTKPARRPGPVDVERAAEDLRDTEAARKKHAKLINFKFENVSLDAVRLFIAKESGLEIIDAAHKQGMVSVRVEGMVTVEEALAIYDSILLAHGAVAERVGNQITIVPVARPKRRRDLREEVPPPKRDLVTQRLRLKHLNAGTIAEHLRPLVITSGNLAVDERNNTLIITDTPANLRRLWSLIGRLDRDIE